MNSPDRVLWDLQGEAIVSANPHGETIHSRFDQRFELCDDPIDQRPHVQDFIQRCFAASHSARIEHFMPRLLSLRARHGDLIAAFGLRAAGHGPLFLESYLDEPIEAVLHARFGRKVRREDIIEVGNLSAAHPAATRWLILAVIMLLQREGYQWIAFTATNIVRNGLFRLGLQPQELGAAALHRLPPHEQGRWGTYYQHSPVVMTGEVDRGYKSLLANEGILKLLGSKRDAFPMDGLA
jgi:hypothetical protein